MESKSVQNRYLMTAYPFFLLFLHLMKFKEIPGNKEIKDTLRSLVDADKIPHALMLYGQPGIGKMMTARAFAQYAHCQHRHNGEPCGQCPSCRQHQSLNHPDVHFSYPIVKSKANNILSSLDRVDRWKEMIERAPLMEPETWLTVLDAGNSQPAIHVEEAEFIVRSDSYPSFSSKYKFFIIWLPEKMTGETANKLLKVIEEPSDGTVFILVSNSENDVLPTISSRTRRFNMRPVEESDLSEFLSAKYGLDPASCIEASRLAEGSIAKAVQFATHSGERIEFQELFQNIMRNAYAKKPGALKKIGDEAAGMGREKLRRFLDYMSIMMRENFIYNLKVPTLNAMSRKEESFSGKFAPFIHAGNVEELVSRIADASSHIQRNGNSKVILFSLFLYIVPLLHKKI